MNSLNIELTNCFGIDSLIHEFNFEKEMWLRYMMNDWKKCFMLISLGCREARMTEDIRAVLHMQDFRSGIFVLDVDLLNH